MTIFRFSGFLIALLCFPLASNAEIVKKASLCKDSICLHWWPNVPIIKGWHHDEEQSLLGNINALAPDGHDFVNAETVMYANAVYKPRVPESKTLQDFIENDKKAFLETLISETPGLITADRQKITTFSFLPQGSGNWERIGYGEEGEYFLVFTISSRSRSGFESSMKDFEQLVKAYKTNP